MRKPDMWLVRKYFNDLTEFYAGDEGRFTRMVGAGGKQFETASPAGWATHLRSCITPAVEAASPDEVAAMLAQLEAWGLPQIEEVPPAAARHIERRAPTARRFWNRAYAAGTRITFAGGNFQFHASTPPLVRIAAAGNRFGIFPEPEPIHPEPWILDGIEEHNGKLIAWLKVAWPKPLARFAGHVLVLDYELKPLTRYAASIGHHVDGWGGIGGWIPAYMGPTKDRKEYKPAGLPPILREYQEVRFG